MSIKSIVMFFIVNLFPNSIIKLLPEATIIVAWAVDGLVKHYVDRRGSVLSEHKRGSRVISAKEDQTSLLVDGL